MIKASQRHLADVGETYLEHLAFASAVGLACLGIGLACIIHALVPALCQTTCSRTIGELNSLFQDRSRLKAFQESTLTVRAFVIVTIFCLVAVTSLLGSVGLQPLPLAMCLLLGAFVASFLVADPELRYGRD